MKHQIQIQLLLLVTLLLASCGSIKAPAGSSLNDVTIGQSLGEGTDNLIAYARISEKAFYVKDSNTNIVLNRLNGENLGNSYVAFDVNGQNIELETRPISSLDRNLFYEEGDFGTLEGYKCVNTQKKGKCLNYNHEDTGKFNFSMRVPQGGVSWCKEKKGFLCDWVVAIYRGRTWDKKNCQGKPAGQHKIRICYDTRL